MVAIEVFTSDFGSLVLYRRKIFQEIYISYPVIRNRYCPHHRVRNARFWEKFAYVNWRERICFLIKCYLSAMCVALPKWISSHVLFKSVSANQLSTLWNTYFLKQLFWVAVFDDESFSVSCTIFIYYEIIIQIQYTGWIVYVSVFYLRFIRKKLLPRVF